MSSAVLGIRGKSRSGKDTFGDYLVSRYGWKKLSFALNLKTMCQEVFQLSEDQVHSQEGKSILFPYGPVIFSETHLSEIVSWMKRTHPQVDYSKNSYGNLLGKKLVNARDIMQYVGTEVCRGFVDTYHLDIIFQQLSSEYSWVITDVRFTNEADGIVGLGGQVFEVINPFIEKQKGFVINKSHPSEIEMDNWGKYLCRFYNDVPGLRFFYEKIDYFMKLYGSLWDDADSMTTTVTV